jgi:ATP-dependent DNA helicase RecG
MPGPWGIPRALEHPDGICLLRARGLAIENTLTVAGVLIFATNPQRFLPESFIRVLRYLGNERGTGTRQQLIRDEKIEGPIPMQLVKAWRSSPRRSPGDAR